VLFQQTKREIQALPPSIPSTSSSILASKIPSTISSNEIKEPADCRLGGEALNAGDGQGAMDSENSLSKESWNDSLLNFFNGLVLYIRNRKLHVLNQGQYNQAITISGKRAYSESS